MDKDRFPFYGFSYGGYTAIGIGPGKPRFKVVIDRGNFNHTTSKCTDLTLGISFLFSRDGLDQYNFGWLNTLSDSILASLIAPRAFMAEEGDNDPIVVEPRQLVESEIACYLEVYRRLGIPERGQVDRFPKVHQIHGVGTFVFPDKSLKQTE